MKYRFTFHFFFFLFIGTMSLPLFVYAAPATSIESLTVEVKNDFVLEPGKAELFLNPGETVTRSVYVTDRVPGKTSFKVEVEDIKGTRDENQPVLILDGVDGPYSGKSFIEPAISDVTLSFGQRITIPVTITIPKNAPPGEYDSVVLISNEPTVNSQTNATGVSNATRIISRLGTLVFIRVNGTANEAGKLDDLKIKGPSKLFYNSGPFTFQILFNNSGNVHLVPYGTVTIKNMLGQAVSQLPVDAYFALPDSLRYREVTWDYKTLLGRYTATVELNRGYGNLVDSKTIAFWVLPWKLLVGVFITVFLVILVVVIFSRTFEFKRKNRSIDDVI